MKNILGIGLNTWNSEKDISILLESLKNQKFKKFTLYLLDNKSVDKTVEITKKYKKKINIKIIIDNKKRDIPTAQKKLFFNYLTRHKYSMFVNDDDKYHPNYISEVLKKIKKDDLDMAYSKYYLFSKKKTIRAKNYPLYNNKNSQFVNVIKFLIYRNVVPIFFGIYKSITLKNTFKSYTPILNSKSNYDNQFILNFLSKYKVGVVNRKLFYYSQKDRLIIDKNKGGYKVIYNQYKSLYSIFIIQFTLLKRFFLSLKHNDNFNSSKKLFIFFFIILIFFQKSFSYNIKFLVRKLLK